MPLLFITRLKEVSRDREITLEAAKMDHRGVRQQEKAVEIEEATTVPSTSTLTSTGGTTIISLFFVIKSKNQNLDCAILASKFKGLKNKWKF
jgi:hypothetical protein